MQCSALNLLEINEMSANSLTLHTDQEPERQDREAGRQNDCGGRQTDYHQRPTQTCCRQGVVWCLEWWVMSK